MGDDDDGDIVYDIRDGDSDEEFDVELVLDDDFLAEEEEPLSPPIVVRGMTELDKNKFKKTVEVPTILVEEHHVGKVVKSIKKHMLVMRKLQNITKDTESPGKKRILLDPYLLMDESVTDLKEELQIDESNMKEAIVYGVATIELGYENWNSEDILKAVFPHDLPNVTGFSVVGHIAHLNLKDSHSPYKSVIGQVLLDTNKHLKSVVNKTNTIDNTYRNFQMELLAGDPDMNVTLKENGCTFKFDFSKVYWNSRLGTEHERIVKEITAETIVYDVFAGVGPFSVPAAKKGATVICNDLNPASHESLVHNLKKNKVKGVHKPYNMDGRAFIREVVKADIISHLKDNKHKPMAVVMNLPALAIEFLDAFKGLITLEDAQPITRPQITVYCYCFSKDPEGTYEDDVCYRIHTILSQKITPEQCRRVRNVAPNKDMMCAKFPLSWDILCSESRPSCSEAKKLKLDCDERGEVEPRT